MNAESIFNALYLIVTGTLIPVGVQVWRIIQSKDDKIKALLVAHAQDLKAQEDKYAAARSDLVAHYESLLAEQRKEAISYAKAQTALLREERVKERADGRKSIEALVQNTQTLQDLVETINLNKRLMELIQNDDFRTRRNSAATGTTA